MINAIVSAVCTSKEKGTLKENINKANFIENWGVENDAHSGKWHRQISLLSKGEIDKFNREGANVEFGAFGENIVVDSYDLKSLAVGTVIEVGNDTVLRVSQIGKKCHSGCDIFLKMGHCIMPTNGIFAKVIHGGIVQTGDPIRIYESHRVAIITLSDKASRGERIDTSSSVIEDIVKENGYEVSMKQIIPDDQEMLEKLLIDICDSNKAELVLTTGGTGFSQRDITPEATKNVIEKEVPGISEYIRSKSVAYTTRAILSRGVSGIRKNSLIINLSGSPIAVKEQLNSIIEPLKHGIDTLCGLSFECAREEDLKK